MSSDLQWLLVRKWNSFQVPNKTGRTLTREPVSRASIGQKDGARARWNIKPEVKETTREVIAGGLGCGLDVGRRKRSASGGLEGILDELGREGGEIADSIKCCAVLTI